jgi:hypothetical protein
MFHVNLLLFPCESSHSSVSAFLFLAFFSRQCLLDAWLPKCLSRAQRRFSYLARSIETAGLYLFVIYYIIGYIVYSSPTQIIWRMSFDLQSLLSSTSLIYFLFYLSSRQKESPFRFVLCCPILLHLHRDCNTRRWAAEQQTGWDAPTNPIPVLNQNVGCDTTWK